MMCLIHGWALDVNNSPYHCFSCLSDQHGLAFRVEHCSLPVLLACKRSVSHLRRRSQLTASDAVTSAVDPAACALMLLDHGLQELAVRRKR